MLERENRAECIAAIGDVFAPGTSGWQLQSIRAGAAVYRPGDNDAAVYLVESGQVDIVVISSNGDKRTSEIHVAGEIFGELSLSGIPMRRELAVARTECRLKRMEVSEFVRSITAKNRTLALLEYLFARISAQQEVIGYLLTASCEVCLARTLSVIARKLGTDDATGSRLLPRMSHNELAEMVGTTRPRVSEFIAAFKKAGLLWDGPRHQLLIDEARLDAYLASMTPPLPANSARWRVKRRRGLGRYGTIHPDNGVKESPELLKPTM